MEPNTNSSVPIAGETGQIETRKDGASRRLPFERIAVYLIIGLVALLPVLFLPLRADFTFTKTALALTIALIAFILFIVGRLKEGVLGIPYNTVFGALWALPVVYLFSALFAAPNLPMAFWGQRIETDTVFFVMLMALLATLVPLLVRTKQQILSVYMGLFISFAILVVYQGLRLVFGIDFLSFDVFTNSTSNLLGKWNDMGIFFGLTAILSLITLEGLKLRRSSQVVLYATLLLSLCALALVNFRPVWIALCIFALGFFVYSFFRERLHGGSQREGAVLSVLKYPKISVLAVAVLSVATIFAIWSATLGNVLPTFLNISHLEARPSWASTVEVLKGTYAQNAFLGSGPNTFTNQWVTFKPQLINSSIFWNVDFSAGIGVVPTALITTGIVGGIVWVLFLGALVLLGIRTLLLRPTGEGFSYYLALSSFIASVYLWVFMVIYVPNVVITVLAFLFTGLFLASLRQQGMLKEKFFAFAENPKIGFISVLGLTVLLILSLAGLYIIGERYVSAFRFERAIAAYVVKGDLTAARADVAKAIATLELDSHHQFAAELQLLKINEIINSLAGTLEERREKFQQALASAIQHGQRATALRAENYQNWLVLGRVYASMVPLQIQGAYDNAKQAYEKARLLAPHHPQVYLSLAELDAMNQNNEGATTYLAQALAEKNNYTAAVFLLAQIQIADGDLENALQSVEAATVLAPQNPVVFFQLGLLRYNKQDFKGAAAALTQAVQLNEMYANARYFLGLAYFKENRPQEAIAQFVRIAELNPDNAEVKLILENLRAGREPFADADALAPEKRPSPPIDGE